MTPRQLKGHRTKLGMTQEQLSERIGITRKTYASYESGASKMPKPIEQLLDFIFGIETSQLKLVSGYDDSEREKTADIFIEKILPYIKLLETRIEAMKCELDGVKEILKIDKNLK